MNQWAMWCSIGTLIVHWYLLHRAVAGHWTKVLSYPIFVHLAFSRTPFYALKSCFRDFSGTTSPRAASQVSLRTEHSACLNQFYHRFRHYLGHRGNMKSLESQGEVLACLSLQFQTTVQSDPEHQSSSQTYSWPSFTLQFSIFRKLPVMCSGFLSCSIFSDLRIIWLIQERQSVLCNTCEWTLHLFSTRRERTPKRERKNLFYQ